MRQSAPDMQAKIRHRGADSLYYFLFGTFFIYALSRAILSTTQIEVSLFVHIGICLSWTFVFYIMLFNRYTIIVFSGICITAVAAAYLYLRSGDRAIAVFEPAVNFVQGTVQIIQGSTAYSSAMDIPLTICIVMPIAFFASLFLHVTYSGVGLILAALVATTAMELTGYSPDMLSKALICLLIVIFLVRTLNGGARGSMVNATFSILSTPLCLLILAVAWLLPKPGDTDLNAGAVVAAGYSSAEEMELGGSMLQRSSPVMTVQSDERVNLKGMIRDRYTGTSWTATDSEQTRLFQNSDGGYTLMSPADELAEDAIRTVIITPEKATTDIFSPGWTVNITFTDTVTVMTDSMDSMEARNDFSRSYTVSYIKWDSSFLDGQPETATEEDLSLYLTLPNTLPTRVSDLAKRITQNAENPYEKATAIMTYLQGYSYTLDTGDLPAGEDFVDYFLFELQEGYCTSFASAMAVMARAVGLPSRYVTGYAMPAESENGAYTVTSDQAHAWAEIYISGVGWVEFDPTPSDYYLDTEEGARDTAAIAPVTPTPEEQESASPTETPATQTDDADTDMQDSAEEDTASHGAALTILITSLGAVAVALVLILLIRRQRRLKSLTNSQAVVRTFEILLRDCAKAGYPLLPGETAESFARRLQGVQGTPNLLPSAEIFSKASYSLAEISWEERTVVVDALTAFHRREKASVAAN